MVAAVVADSFDMMIDSDLDIVLVIGMVVDKSCSLVADNSALVADKAVVVVVVDKAVVVVVVAGAVGNLVGNLDNHLKKQQNVSYISCHNEQNLTG